MSNSSSLIELIYQELENKTEFFLKVKTGSVWEVYIQNRKLIIKVFNFSFQITPSSESTFRPGNTLINLKIEFEKLSAINDLHMPFYAKGIKRDTFFLCFYGSKLGY